MAKPKDVSAALKEFKEVFDESYDELLKKLGVSEDASEDEDEEEPEDEEESKKDEDPDEEPEEEDAKDEESERFFPTLEEIDGLDLKGEDGLEGLMACFGDEFAEKLSEKKEKTQREVLKALVGKACDDEMEGIEEKYVSFAAKLLGVSESKLAAKCKEIMSELEAEDDKDEKPSKKSKDKDADEDDDLEDETESDEESDTEEETPKRRKRKDAGMKRKVKRGRRKAK